MVERIALGPDSEEPIPSQPEAENKKKNKRKRKKRAGGLGAIAAGTPERGEKDSEEDSEKPSKEKPRALKGILDLAEKEPEASAEDSKDAPDKQADQYEPLPVYELKPDEFSGGEVIINLRGDVPRAVEIAPAEQPDELIDTDTEASLDAELIPEDSVLEMADEQNAHLPEAPPVNRPAVESAPDEDAVITRATAAPRTATGSSGAQPPVPPAAAAPSFSGGNYQPPAAVLYQQNTLPPAPNIQPSVTPETKRYSQAELDDADYYGRKRGKSEGFWTGALAVGGYEHFKHRRRERKMKKEFARERETHEKTVEDMRWDQIRKEQNEKWRAAEAARFTKPESRVGVKPEESKAAQKPEANPEAAEQELQVPEGHHVERSAWHSVEVDERGHRVEDSVINYGHEYYKERAKEAAPIDKAQIKNVTGGVALTAAAMQDIDENDQSEEALLSRQNREFAGVATQKSGKGSKRSDSPGDDGSQASIDSIANLIPLLLVLLLIGTIIWILL